MATFEATTTPVTFAHMEGELKTVHVVPRTNEYDGVSSGDRIEFDPLGSITIGAIRRYDTLKELLETEGFQNVVPDAETLEEATEADVEPSLVRSKRFSIKPMSPEEAAAQMELLGHDFYVFRNAETEQVNVLYRRKDGNYGLIEPEF